MVSVTLRSSREISSHLASTHSILRLPSESSKLYYAERTNSCRCAVHPPAWKAASHTVGYHGNSRAENETILHASLRECKQVGGLTRLMCSRYVGQRPNCSTIDPPSERAMPAAAAVSREARCSAACILVVHGADHADQPVSSAAETLLSNRACRDEARYVLHCTALSVLYCMDRASTINRHPSCVRGCGCASTRLYCCYTTRMCHREVQAPLHSQVAWRLSESLRLSATTLSVRPQSHDY